MSRHILRVDAGMRINGSYGRGLADVMVERLLSPGSTLHRRDLAEGVDFVDEAWIEANFTEASNRTTEQRRLLAVSDALVAEIEAADTLVIAVPIYNFGVPAAFKAWVDMVTRARKTFRHTGDGPVGLLTGKQVFVIVTSGGTLLGSEADFVSDWLRHALGFIGLTNLELIDAGGLGRDEAGVLARSHAAIEALLAMNDA